MKHLIEINIAIFTNVNVNKMTSNSRMPILYENQYIYIFSVP